MISIRQLTILKAIVETGTVTAAAQRVDITQPAVSKALSSLEAYAGFKVFERRRKRLVLSERGQSLYAEAHRLLGMVDDFDGIVADIRERGAQRIRLATTPIIATSGFASRALADFCIEHPNLHVEIESMQRQELVRTAIGDKADIIIGNLPFTSDKIKTTRFGDNNILAVARKGTFLHDVHVVTPALLSKVPVIFLFERSRLRRIIDHYMYRAGVALQIRAQVANSSITIQAARNGMGVGICDGLSLLDTDTSNLDIRVFNEPLSTGIGFLSGVGETDNTYRQQLEALIVAHWEQQNAPFFVT